MNRNLPLHPRLLHPLTGRPLQAVGVLPSGRVVWPIIGASTTPPEADAAAAAAAQKATDDAAAAAAKKTADDAAAAEAAKKAAETAGFPANTAVENMTVAQQAAYWKWHSKKHEDRATEWRTLVGGGSKTAAEVAAELETQRKAAMTTQERAIAEAKEAGKQEATSGMSQAMATLALETAMAHVPETERPELLAMIDRSTVIKADGTIDTDKVAKIVARIAPANGRRPNDPDFGGGNRGSGDSGSGVGAGRSRFQERHGAKKTTT